MKKQIVLLAILIASLGTVKSQVSFSVPVGFSTLKTPTIGANFQYQFFHFILAAGFDAQVSKKLTKGDYFWARTGAAFTLSELNQLELTAGFGSYDLSSVNKELNKGLAQINVQYVHQMESRPNGALFASVTGTEKFVIVSGGLRFIFGRGDKRGSGCPSTW